MKLKNEKSYWEIVDKDSGPKCTRATKCTVVTLCGVPTRFLRKHFGVPDMRIVCLGIS